MSTPGTEVALSKAQASLIWEATLRLYPHLFPKNLSRGEIASKLAEFAVAREGRFEAVRLTGMLAVTGEMSLEGFLVKAFEAGEFMANAMGKTAPSDPAPRARNGRRKRKGLRRAAEVVENTGIGDPAS